MGRGDQLAVLGGEVVLLRHFIQNFRRERFLRDLGVEEHQLTILLAQLFAVGRRQQCGAPRVLAFLDPRGGCIPEIHLAIVKFIAGVDGVADAGEVGQCVDVFIQGLLFQESGLGGSIVRRGGEALRYCGKLRLDLIQIRALIGHLRKFHVYDLLCAFCRHYSIEA